MSVPDRIRLIRDSLGKTREEMASALGITARTWQDYERGINLPGWKVVDALVKMGFNANWIYTGEGDSHSGPALLKHVVAERDFDYTKVTEADADRVQSLGFVLVPRYEVAASAGGGSIIHSEQIVDYLSFKTEWIRNGLGLSEKDLALINVKGDSMEPTLSNEDLILVDLRSHQVEDNAVYVLQFGGILLVKRIQRKLDGTVIVRSDNAIYEPEVVKGDMLETLNVVGRVVWCGRRM